MNINYINESVISVAVMRRKQTRTHEANRERTVCVRRMFVVVLQSEAQSIAGRLARDL